MFQQFVVVLHKPRDVRNIGAVVRAMKNMGFARLRLVEPAPFAPEDILGIAHRSEDLLGTLELYADLDAALADVRYVLGTSERGHPERTQHNDLRSVAGELVARAVTAGPVAVLFGPEHNGLDNAALDRCHALLSLPADPGYPSLNLAQAAMLVLYELRMAASAPLAPLPPRTPAVVGELESCYNAITAALNAIRFAKSGDATTTMRTLRGLLARAEPDSHEAALIAAIAREVVYALRRTTNTSV